MAREKPDFQEVDINTLDGTQSAAFLNYIEAKDAFRATLQTLAQPGERVLFTEKYGTASNIEQSKLKIAFVKAPKAKGDKPKLNLEQYRAGRESEGRDC